MTTKEPNSSPDNLTRQRQALHAVLSSSVFKKSPQMARLLEYISEKYFSGSTEDVKEYFIAVEVFRRPDSFDPANDSIVRVEIHRLRKKLREFYDGEGADQKLEIVVASGKYIPEFVERTTSRASASSAPGEVLSVKSALGDALEEVQTKKTSQSYKVFWVAGALVAFVGLVLATLVALEHSRKPYTGKISAPTSATSLASISDTTVRIRCGYTRTSFRDRSGNVWSGDRFYMGGFASEIPAQYIAGTRDPQLDLTYRTGTFSYKIPLKPGTYEMRLYFSETAYGPATTLGGGENSRVFNVKMNGNPLLTQFDIASDAGVNTSDVRVFKDVHPGSDGYLRLDFIGIIGSPMINAIEIIPGIPHRLHTIRMVAQNDFFVDKAGNIWSPDSYFSGGQLAADKIAVSGTDDPGLYAGERYGNFSYAIPVDTGKYTLTLYFSEKYFGLEASKNYAPISRVFDVLFNQRTTLIQSLNIEKEVGPGRALQKTFYGLQPNAQGKLIVSFVPDINYALVDAIEVKDETP